MRDKPKKVDAPEGDPKRGDEILRRMLKTKPKPHSEMVKGRKAAKGLKQVASKPLRLPKK